jgi:hypothetical protein
VYPLVVASWQLVRNPSIALVQLPAVAPKGGMGGEHCLIQLGTVPLQLPALHIIEPHERQLLPAVQFSSQLKPEATVSNPTGHEPAIELLLAYKDVRVVPLQELAVMLG